MATLALAHVNKGLTEVEFCCCLIQDQFGFCSQKSPKLLECVWSGTLKCVGMLSRDGQLPCKCHFSSGWRSGGAWKCSIILKSGCSTVTGWVDHTVCFWGELVLLVPAAVDSLLPLMGKGWDFSLPAGLANVVPVRGMLQLLMNRLSLRIHRTPIFFLEKEIHNDVNQ